MLDDGGPADEPEQRQARAHVRLAAPHAHAVRALEHQLAQLDRGGVQAQVADRGREPARAGFVGDPLPQARFDGRPQDRERHSRESPQGQHGAGDGSGLPDGRSHAGSAP